jgi:hypothetical protein
MYPNEFVITKGNGFEKFKTQFVLPLLSGLRIKIKITTSFSEETKEITVPELNDYFKEVKDKISVDKTILSFYRQEKK